MKKTDHVLRYVSVYNDLKTAITSEKYPPGSFLPTENELVDSYSASRTTIRRAISMLQNEGLVNVQQGRGTEVLYYNHFSEPYNFQKFRNIINVSSKPLIDGEATTQGAVVDIVPAEIKTAKALAVDMGTNIYRIQRIKMIKDTVFAYVVSYVPCNIAPGLEQHSGKIFRLYQCLKQNYDLTLTYAEESISADTSKFLESKLLNIPIGSPLLVFHRTAHYENGILEYAESFIRPDLYHVVISMQGGFDYMDEKDFMNNTPQKDA